MTAETLPDEMPVAAPAADPSTELPDLHRRGALGLLSRAGMVLVGAVAGLTAAAAPARADCLGSPCCSLASCTQCRYSGRKCNYTCPSGYSKRVWYCHAAARIIGCGECAKGSNCDLGPWACSIWWDDAVC